MMRAVFFQSRPGARSTDCVLTGRAGADGVYEAVRTANALYVRYAGGAQEYYDTAADPYELDNLAAKGVPADLRNALSALESCHTGTACWAAAHLGPRPVAASPLMSTFLKRPPA